MKPTIKHYKPRRKLMQRLNSPWLAMVTLALFITLAYNAYPTKRLNCQDLGRCNLQTGEVYDMEYTEYPDYTAYLQEREQEQEAAEAFATLFEE
jgi:hypothetical protein